MENNINNILGEAFCNIFDNCSYLDSNNILQKKVNDKFIGKRSVYLHNLSCCQLEETITDNIRSYLCGEDADYSEIFYRL